MRRPVAPLAPLRLLGLACCSALTLAAPAAHATDCSGIESSCINSDILWPHAGPARFVAIGATETVAEGQLGFGLVTSYLSRPIILHVPTPGPGGSVQNAIDNQVNGTFLWAYGVTDRLELDLAVPLTFIQDGAGLSPITGGNALKDTAVRDMRFGFTYAIVPHARVAPDRRPESWGLAARLEVSAPTGDDDQLAGEGTGVFVPSVSADWRHDRIFVGAEVGARLRPISELEGARVGTQLVAALGAGYDILPRELLTAVVEAWALPTLAEQHSVSIDGPATLSTPNGTTIAPAEWQVSARTAPLQGGDFAIQLGGGGDLPLTNGAVTTPRFRFTLGLRWAPAGRPRSASPPPASSTPAPPAVPVVDLHLAGAKDVCTSDPDLVDGFKDTDGCNDEDQDKDGVPDRFDRCPLVPEDFVGLTDGCPEKH
jgi:OOP family OmpA-OmpF porin